MLLIYSNCQQIIVERVRSTEQLKSFSLAIKNHLKMFASDFAVGGINGGGVGGANLNDVGGGGGGAGYGGGGAGWSALKSALYGLSGGGGGGSGVLLGGQNIQYLPNDTTYGKGGNIGEAGTDGYVKISWTKRLHTMYSM